MHELVKVMAYFSVVSLTALTSNKSELYIHNGEAGEEQGLETGSKAS